ncbi:MAG: flagellar hook assembly protein FlgD [Geminicoccaceae bacterium]
MIGQVSDQAAPAVRASTEPADSQVDGNKISEDFEAFLRLMTTQMKNQDPLEPLDGTQFVTQLAQFSQVEQQVKTNDRLDSLLAALTRSDAEVALGFLGRTVETASGRVELEAGEPTKFAFETGGPAKKAVAVVTDASGAEVRKFEVGADAAGRHEALWDGLDSSGAPAVPGVYAIEVQIYDDAGKKVIQKLPALTRAKVLEARFDDDASRLLLSNGAEVGLTDLEAIAG